MTIEEIIKVQKELKISDVRLCELAKIHITTWYRYKKGLIKNPSYKNIVNLINSINSITGINMNMPS